jgi:hypothetical protein
MSETREVKAEPAGADTAFLGNKVPLWQAAACAGRGWGRL